MWFCYSFLRTEPEIPLLWIFISHKRMQQLILNAPIDIIYHLSYLQYFDLLKINNVIYKKYSCVFLSIFIICISWLFDYVYITWKDEYQKDWFVCNAPKQLVRKKSFNNVVSNIISFTTKWVIIDKLWYPNSWFILEKHDLGKLNFSSIAQVLIYCSWSSSG